MKKLILLSLVLVLLVQTISAYTYLNIYVGETGEALFLGETDEELELPQGIEIKEGEIIGRTQALTSKEGELWTFSYFLEGAEINLILPRGAVVKNLGGGEIYLSQDKISIYNSEEIQVDYIIEEVSNLIYVWVLIGLVIIFVVFFYIFKLRKKIEKENKSLEVIKKTLNERERKIIEKLEEVGEIKHTQLRKLIEIPKASFSRHVLNLEKKGLIKRIGEGKNKIIKLN